MYPKEARIYSHSVSKSPLRLFWEYFKLAYVRWWTGVYLGLVGIYDLLRRAVPKGVIDLPDLTAQALWWLALLLLFFAPFPVFLQLRRRVEVSETEIQGLKEAMSGTAAAVDPHVSMQQFPSYNALNTIGDPGNLRIIIRQVDRAVTIRTLSIGFNWTVHSLQANIETERVGSLGSRMINLRYTRTSPNGCVIDIGSEGLPESAAVVVYVSSDQGIFVRQIEINKS